MKKVLSTFLLIIALFTVIGAGFHHHMDGLVHDDCPTCIAVSHSHSITIDNNPDIQKYEFVIQIIMPLSVFLYLCQISSGLTIRAPPFLS